MYILSLLNIEYYQTKKYKLFPICNPKALPRRPNDFEEL